jgi:hypothetical protein
MSDGKVVDEPEQVRALFAPHRNDKIAAWAFDSIDERLGESALSIHWSHDVIRSGADDAQQG